MTRINLVDPAKMKEFERDGVRYIPDPVQFDGVIEDVLWSRMFPCGGE